MTITFRDYNDHGSGTYVDPSNTQTDPKAINITKVTTTEMDYAISSGGANFTIAVTGQFDLSHLAAPLITMADANAAVSNNTLSGTVSAFVVTSNGSYVISQTYAPGLSLPAFSAYQDGTLAGYSTTLSGNDVYNTSANATPTGGAWNGVYLYGGNDTYYENHVLMTYSDIFYGGDGIDTAVLPGKIANYKIQASNFVWDTVNKVSNLTGYIITDTTKTINTLQVNQVERLQFSDTKLALDTATTQAAGQTALLLGAALPGTLALDPTKQALVGAVIGLFDAGFTLQQLSGALLRLPVWDALTNHTNATAADIATYLVHNVYGGTETAAITNAAIAAMTTETPTTQGTYLASLAQSSTGQSHIGLVGLQTSGLAYV